MAMDLKHIYKNGGVKSLFILNRLFEVARTLMVDLTVSSALLNLAQRVFCFLIDIV